MKKHPIFTFLVILGILVPTILHPGATMKAEQSIAPESAPENALGFFGNGYVRVPYSAELNTMSAITIEAWVYRTDTQRNETIIGNDISSSYWFGFITSGKLSFTPDGSPGLIDSKAVIGAGRWTHVAVTYDGSRRNYYINGALDTTTTTGAGPIAGNSGIPLGIGYDVVDLFSPNYFQGTMDEVRIWNVVRTQADIQADMFKPFNFPLPAGLIAYWQLNGNTADQTGNHDGTLQGDFGTYWVTDGPIPHDMRIPQVSNTPTLDGKCDTGIEYDNATAVSGAGATIYLEHTDSDLWICFDFGTANNYSRASVLLDPNHDRLDPAQPEDIRLDVNYDDVLNTFTGDDSGHWVATTAYDGQWSGAYAVYGPVEFPYYNAEFRLNASLVNGWSHVIGLALDPYIHGYLGDLAGMWPALSYTTLPSTWSEATLGAISPLRVFSGEVLYQPKNNSYPATGIEGARVDLYGYDAGGSEALVGTQTSGPSGVFSLTTDDDFTSHRLELEDMPQGYTWSKAEAPSPGVAVGVRTIDYPDAPAPGDYPDNKFILTDVTPWNVNAPYGPVYLIIAPQDVIYSGALEDFRNFKLQQGFAVSIRSVEEADTYPGFTRLEKIRALEQEYKQNYGDRFKFVLLVGPDKVIPYAQFTLGATGTPGSVCPSNGNFRYSEWMYVDLTSNFDSNNNGCFADGIFTKASNLVPGYTPDSGIAFQVDVVVGRIPYTDPNTIRTVLKNSMGFEKQSEQYKTNVLLAMSQITLKGYKNGQPCTFAADFSSRCVDPLPNDQTNYDLSKLAETMKSDYLNSSGYDSTILYENEEEIAGGTGIHSPTEVSSHTVTDELNNQSFGLANLGGHGGANGVGRVYWKNDLNGNGVFDVAGPMGNELGGGALFVRDNMSDVTPSGARAPIFMLIECSTGSPTDENNMAAKLLADNKGVASVAGLSTISVSSWENPDNDASTSTNYYITRRLLADNYRLGEAVWWTLSDGISSGQRSTDKTSLGLFGDPSLSFFGNPSGETTLAAWPMGRHDASGTSYLTLPGPSVPKQLWSYTAEPIMVDPYTPAPLVSNNGEVIVASGNYVDVLRQGQLYQRLNLDNSVYGSPALSADGTIYVMDNDARLYAFPYKLVQYQGITIQSNERYLRWTVDLGDIPTASPIVGSDGFIIAGSVDALGNDPVLRLVRPDGTLYHSNEYSIAMRALYFAAAAADRSIYVTTNDGDNVSTLYRFDGFCDHAVEPNVCDGQPMQFNSVSDVITGPPLLANNALYVGTISGKIYKFDPKTLAIQATYTADNAISSPIIAGPAGSLFFVTNYQTLNGLSSNLDFEWKADLGGAYTGSIPAASVDAIYLVFGGYLHAYNPNSGTLKWKRSIGTDTPGSVSVGYGREVYVQTSDGAVKAFGEGWALAMAQIDAVPFSEFNRPFFRIDLQETLPPINGAEQPAPQDAPQAAASIVGILLQRSENGGPWEDVSILPPSATSYIDSSVSPDTSYAYRAQNLMSDGNNSDFETTLDVARSSPDFPLAPVLNSVDTVGSDSLSLNWTEPVDNAVSSFRVERSLAPEGLFTPVFSSTASSNVMTDTGLTPATTYYYRVIAVNQTGESVPSNVLSNTTRSLTLAAPENVHAVLAEPEGIDITWDAGPAGATAVIEKLDFGEADYAPLDTAPADGSYTFNTGEVGAYSFRVKFVKGTEESPYTKADTDVVISESWSLYLPVIDR